MKFLILGYPRSATNYAAIAFMKTGFYCTHERDETVLNPFFKRKKDIDGLCTGLFISCERNLEKYDLIYHQTRHPLKVINSAQSMSWRSMQDLGETCQIEFHKDETKLYRVMKTWLAFTDWADSVSSIRYPVEKMRDHWKQLLRPMGISTIFPARMSTMCNTWSGKRIPKKEVTWDDLLECDDPMGREILVRTREYGYEP